MERAEKEAAKEAKSKGKRGRKCKSAMPKENEAEIDKAETNKLTADKADVVGSARGLRQRQMRQSQMR